MKKEVMVIALVGAVVLGITGAAFADASVEIVKAIDIMPARTMEAQVDQVMFVEIEPAMVKLATREAVLVDGVVLENVIEATGISGAYEIIEATEISGAYEIIEATEISGAFEITEATGIMEAIEISDRIVAIQN